jgi:hypothetical protein
VVIIQGEQLMDGLTLRGVYLRVEFCSPEVGLFTSPGETSGRSLVC